MSADSKTETPNILEAHEVHLEYWNSEGLPFTAVENVSFRVKRGEKFVLLGPSGCGKSTLLKAIGGFQPITSGELLYKAKPIRNAGPDRAIVFQEFDQLFPWQTVRGNLLYALKKAKNMKGAAANERTMQLLELVGIAASADKYPHTLSGGMKMRAAIARALAMEPEMLLMDEPFAALDAITRRQLQIELNNICEKTQVTLVMVTHSIPEAIFLGNRVMVMTPAPSTVRQIVDTTNIENFDSPEFTEYSARLQDLLIQPETVAA